jgi:hypothetical protein
VARVKRQAAILASKNKTRGKHPDGNERDHSNRRQYPSTTGDPKINQHRRPDPDTDSAVRLG